MHGLKERKGKKRKLVTGMGEPREKKLKEGRTRLGKIQWPKVPVSHPQPSPWSKSDELYQFYTRV
jgi:hypothetical protein